MTDTTTEPTRATAEDAGCWVDGVHGIYAPVNMVAIARGYGFPWPYPDTDPLVMEWAQDAGAQVRELPDGTDYAEAWHELQDDAEEWLQDHVAPEGYSFGWIDGDFMLASESDWCSWSDDTCDDPGHDHSPDE